MSAKILNEEQARYWIGRLKRATSEGSSAIEAVSMLADADAAARVASKPDDVSLDAVEVATEVLNEELADDGELLDGIEKLRSSIEERVNVLQHKASAPSREEMERENLRRANMRSKIEDLMETTDSEELRKLLLDRLRRNKFD